MENGTTVRADRGLRPLRLLPLSDSLTEGRTKGKRRQQRRASQVSAIRQASCLLAWSKRWALGCANSPPWPENARRGITQHLVRLLPYLSQIIVVGGRRILLTERKRVANPHCREGRRPSTSLIAGQVAPEPALEEGKVMVRRERVL